MKKLLTFLAIMAIGIIVFAQDTSNVSKDIQSLTVSKIWEGVVTFWSYLNWVFIVAFIIFSGIFNMYVSAENKAGWLNWFRKVPMAIWVCLIGIMLALIFIFIFDITSKRDIAGLFFSIVFSMGIYKMGIDKFINWLATKFGLQLKK